MNHKYLGNQLGIVTDGMNPNEVLSILKWLNEKTVLDLDGQKIMNEYKSKFALNVEEKIE